VIVSRLPGICREHIYKAATAVLALCVIGCAAARLRAQTAKADISDITGEYEFLNPDNTLAILDEDGELKGYVDVFQGENESDALLSYTITIGSRKDDQVEFRTQKIHEKYYRFSGTADRGPGKAPGDPGYLQLSGELQTITDNSVTGKEKVERESVIFKSKGRTQQSP
jgi:hypothetical protein